MTERPPATPVRVSPSLPDSGGRGGRSVALSDPLTWMEQAFGPVDAEAYAEYLESRGRPLEPIDYRVKMTALEAIAWGRSQRWVSRPLKMDRRNRRRREIWAARKARGAA